VLLAAVALALASCLGPYAEVGQKLDVGLRVTGGEAWISASEPDVRILVLGKDEAGVPAAFAFSSLHVPVASGLSARTYEGLWQEHGDTPSRTTMFLTKQIDYTLADERSVSLTSRRGAFRRDGLDDLIRLDVTRTAGRLTLAGDELVAGTYVPMAEALGHLGKSTASDAACAYHVANLAVMTTQVRIIGFGGPGMLQYRSPETFDGTLAGSVRVAMSGGLTSPDVDIAFAALSDFPGVQLDQGQRTRTDAGGNGRTEGTVRFTIQPTPGDATSAITGAILYDLQITDGYAAGGQYTVTMDGGTTGTVDTAAPPSPSIASCLGLE
jgi:hypothetical protein